MSGIFGKNVKISVFGQSHSEAIGVVIDGLPAGIKIDMDKLNAFMQRRAPGQSVYTTSRREPDAPEILSGVVDGVTCGAPLAAVIRNTNTRSADYNNLRDVPRPAHADFTANEKYKGFQDVNGGGHFSGRLTATICIAGAIALQILESRGIEIFAHIIKIHSESAEKRADYLNANLDELRKIKTKPFPVYDDAAADRMKLEILNARNNLDSVGGIIECAVLGMPVGIGEPMFENIEGKIASMIFSVPAVKGIEFGSGFSCADMYGSEHNDPFYMSEDGRVKTRTNNHGGILGGISSGMPIVFRTAIKPTPSIAKEQDSVSFSEKKDVKLSIRGRHDPCVVTRAVPVIEAAAALAILDLIMENEKYDI